MRHSRAGFERIPANLTRAALFRYCTFAEEDRREINHCRGDANKIGFALLVGGVRLTGRFVYALELVPRSLVAHSCEQLAVDVPLLLPYPQRRPTRAEHLERIKTYLGLRSFTAADRPLITSHIREQGRRGTRLHELLPGTEQLLRGHSIVLPGVTVVQKFLSLARVAAEAEVVGELSERVDAVTKERMLALVQVQPGPRLTPFPQLHRAAGRPSPAAFTPEVELLTQVRQLLPDDLARSDLASPLRERLAGLVRGLPTQGLLQFHEPNRLGLLLCWLWRLRTQLSDTALTRSNELVAGGLRPAKPAATKKHQHQPNRRRAVLTLCSEVVSLVRDQAISDTALRTAVFQRWPREQREGLPAEGRALAEPAEQLYLAEVHRRYSYVRQFAPRWLEPVVLRAIAPHEPLLQAVDYRRDRNRHGQRGLGEDAPLECSPPAWKPSVWPTPDEIDRPLGEICLLEQLRQALKGGNLHGPHSRAFQPLDTYLLTREQWEHERTHLSQEQQLPLDFAQHWPSLAALLSEQLRRLDERYPANPQLEIRDEPFHLARPDRVPVPPAVPEVRSRSRPMLQRRPLSDLWWETQPWTHFLHAVTRLAAGRPVTATATAVQITVLVCLLAEGCNSGRRDRSVGGPGVSFDHLEEVYATYIRDETLAQATATLVNFHLQQPLAEAWGQGTTSRSDARVYGVPVRALNATFHPKYFASAGRGINVYTPVSDRWIPFYTQVITGHVRQDIMTSAGSG